MKNVLLTMVCLIATAIFGGGNLKAQEASVDFITSDDGKTLTISGQGDLTKYQKVSDDLKFTTAGCNNVKDVDNMYVNPVGSGAVYSSDKTYYALYPKKIASLYPDYADATATTSWNEDKIASLYHTSDYGNTWSLVKATDKIDLTDSWTTADGKFGQFSCYATSENGTGRILLADFKNSDYYTVTLSDVSFIEDKKQYLYVVSDDKYVKLADDAVYDASATYYSYTSSFDNPLQYDNFGEISEDEMIRIGYLEHPTESLAQILNYTLSNHNTYTTIKFVNEGTDALTINNDIVKALLYPATATAANANTVLTTLDLGAATCADFSKETFAKGNAQGNVALETLTLPLNESKETPAEVVSNLQGYDGVTLNSVIVPEGYTKVGDNTFNSATNLNDIQLPSTITEIGEKAFYSCISVNEVKLGDNLKTIGKFAFAGCTKLNKLTLPENLDKVCDGAFWNLKNLLVVELNNNLRYIGNGAFGCDGDLADKSATQTTIKIPASVQYIGAYAFSERKFQDVYFLGKVAPVCPVGDFYDGKDTHTDGTAFTGSDDKVHFGNSGFIGKANNKYPLADDADNDGYANRENYNNQGKYFTILHYPADATDEDTYTDTTRKYESRVKSDGTIDKSLKTVGQETESLSYREATNVQKDVDPGYNDTYVDGQYVWPSLSQFVRAYATAALGLKWDGVSKYSPELSPEAKAVLEEAGYDMTRKDLANIAYRGTRKFVIANGDSKSTPEYSIDMKGGQWWTLCVPFNMTKKMIDETFGANTEVCLFDRVVRQVNNITKKNRIVLYFTQNVYAHKTEPKGADGKWNFDQNAPAPEEDEIVIYAHESYMIHPTKTDEDAVFVVNNYQLVEGSPTPTIVMGTNQYVGESDVPDNVPYRYVGNYLAKSEERGVADVKIPMYSYVYAKAGNDKPKFWFLTDDKMTWKPNKCVVQTNERGAGEDDFANFFDFEATGAKQASFFGADFDDSTTSIDEMEIVAGEKTCSPIYSLDGKLVSRNGDKASLAKGIYVQGGKKFVIK